MGKAPNCLMLFVRMFAQAMIFIARRNGMPLWLLFTCFCVNLAVAGDHSVFATHVNPDGTVAVPKYLFHWSALSGMIRAANSHPGSKVLPMKDMRDSLFADRHALPESTEALFAWSHPTTAMAVNENEEYASGPHPVLLMLKPSPSAKTMVVTTIGDQTEVERATLLNGIDKNVVPDLILHIYKKNNADVAPLFREWIVVNPRSIAWYSANPDDFPAEVKDEIANTPLKHVEKEEEFYNYYVSPDPELQRHVIEGRNSLKSDELRRYSTLRLRDIPPVFKTSHLLRECVLAELSRLVE
ncbi:MAG: hypothetical protein P4M08_00700 [Oligoflexia bacterium]|nr:hypothetical protein [Oligoflexia bacterium]